MAALPRKWVSGGAPTLPWQTIARDRIAGFSQRLVRLGKSYSLNQQFIDQHLGAEAGAW